jgi:MerR family transcriptional regulator, light-induced transcriptional regulator
MSAVRTNTAAAMLGVSASTLRSWERRFSFPAPRRSTGGHRQFDLQEVEALREALAQTGEIGSAVALARERGKPTASPVGLRDAFSGFDEARANRLLEESLAVRSLERTVDELLLPTVAALESDASQRSPEYAFAWRYATGWIAAAQRVAPPATRDGGVLLFDASAPGELDALHVQALELHLRRRGMRTLTLAAELDPALIGRALRALEGRALVLAGRNVELDLIGRLVYAARQVGGDLVVFDFRGALPDTGASTVTRLSAAPLAACETLLAVLDTPIEVRRLAGPRVRRFSAARGEGAAPAIVGAS